MIHLATYTGHSYEDCFSRIDIPDDKVINVVPRGSKRSEGFDEYDFWETFFVDVIYKD